MKKICFIFFVLFIISGIFFTVSAEEKGELQITVMLGTKEVSLEAQVMVMLEGRMPLALQPGQEKSLKLEAGTYQVIVVVPNEKMAAGEVTVKAGEIKRITMNLKDMPDPNSGEMPDMKDMVTDDDKFVPEEATEDELKEL